MATIERDMTLDTLAATLEPERVVCRRLTYTYGCWCGLVSCQPGKARDAASVRWSTAFEIVHAAHRQHRDALDPKHIRGELSIGLIGFLAMVVARHPAGIIDAAISIRAAHARLIGVALRLRQTLPEAASVLAAWDTLLEIWQSGRFPEVDQPGTLAGAAAYALAGGSHHSI